MFHHLAADGYSDVVRTGFEPVWDLLFRIPYHLQGDVGVVPSSPSGICVFHFRHLTILEKICGVAPLPIQPKNFARAKPY